MPSYKRFSDNSVQTDSSYQRFDKESFKQNDTPSPQDLQKQREAFNMRQKKNPPPEPHVQTELPTINQQPSSAQLMRMKEQEMRQERSLHDQEAFQQPEIDFSTLNVTELEEVIRNFTENEELHPLHVREVYRLLQVDETLSIEQAIRLAQGNGCYMDGVSEMCPSRPKMESFKQKGDCSGDDCNVQFNKRKMKESYQEVSVVDKIKQLGQITFYSSSGCGFCNQTKQLLTDSGLMGNNVGDQYIKVLENQPLPSGVRGYPHFVRGDRSHTGFPRSLDRFYDLMK